MRLKIYLKFAYQRQKSYQAKERGNQIGASSFRNPQRGGGGGESETIFNDGGQHEWRQYEIRYAQIQHPTEFAGRKQ